jgi:hypothetical protein
MRKFKLSGVMLAAVCVLSAFCTASAASAFELPDVHALSGESGKVITISGTSKTPSFFESEIGEKVTDEEFKYKLELTSLSASGVGTVDLSGVKWKTSSCTSEGDPTGTVLIKGEFHIVVTNKKPLELGALLTFTSFFVTCGPLKLKIAGALIGHLTTELNKDIGSLGLLFKCSSKARQAVSSYFNDEEKLVEKQLLLSNFGLGFESGCKEAAEVKSEVSPMAEITG